MNTVSTTPAAAATADYTTPATEETLPPITCQPWCTAQDGHTRADSPRDQYCSTEQLSLELARDPEQLGDRWFRREVTAGLEADAHSDAHVSLCITGNARVELTPAGARQLGMRLVRLSLLPEGV